MCSLLISSAVRWAAVGIHPHSLPERSTCWLHELCYLLGQLWWFQGAGWFFSYRGWMGWCAGRCCGWYSVVIGVSSGCATLCKSCFWWWIWGDAGRVFWGNKSSCKQQGASACLEGSGGFFLFLDYFVHHTQVSLWRDTIRILEVSLHMVGIGFILIEWLPWVLISGFSHWSVGFPEYGNL